MSSGPASGLGLCERPADCFHCAKYVPLSSESIQLGTLLQRNTGRRFGALARVGTSESAPVLFHDVVTDTSLTLRAGNSTGPVCGMPLLQTILPKRLMQPLADLATSCSSYIPRPKVLFFVVPQG